MSIPTDSVAPASPTGSSHPWPLWQWFKRITDWIAALSPSGAAAYDTGRVPLALQPDWSNYSGSFQECHVYRIGVEVSLEGLVRASTNITTANAVIAVLPQEFRPPKRMLFTCLAQIDRTTGPASTGTAHTHKAVNMYAGVRVEVREDGEVRVAPQTFTTFTSTAWVSLNGVRWRL